MKKVIATILLVTFLFGVTACSVESAPMAEEEAPNALIPMVMVGGEIYMTTGMESEATERKNDFDGEIVSTVSGSKRPAENNQSNFGTGYGYQFGATEGTIELLMDDRWWIYATEEARDKLFYPERYMVVDEPPACVLTYAEASITPRTCLIAWEFTQEDGTQGALMGDGAHPLDAKHSSPFLTLDPAEPMEVWLHWDIMPDLVEVNCWEENCWEDLESSPSESFRLMEGNEAGDSYLLRPKNGNYIYEIVATWQNAPNFGGTVRYSFHTEE